MIENVKPLSRNSYDTTPVHPSASHKRPLSDHGSTQTDVAPKSLAVPAKSGAQSRLDPFSGDWTIFAPHRTSRPNQFGKVLQVVNKTAVTCPFCAGEEELTPAASWAARIDCNDRFLVFGDPTDVDALDWSVRVVPNKYPVVTDCSSNRDTDIEHAKKQAFQQRANRAESLFQSRELVGGHEVIIESPNHVQSISELDLAETKLLLYAYQQRLRYWKNQNGIQYISLFKNVGGDAGASLQHSHSQLIATDQIPSHVETVSERMRSHQAKTGCCLQCDIVRAELKQKARIVAQTDSLVAYCPYASRLPMLVRVTTKDHQNDFDNLSLPVIDELARLLQRMTGWLETMIPDAAYNVLLHTRPPGSSANEEAFHWSLEFFPRISRLAGFEWSSQSMINTVLPEVATEKYRECAKAEDPRRVL
ncbi:Galactose-1-phosphate uridylyltransferase [Planctomycetes bacterium CA13]|uniref:Galactose-1-phosphate uridylyltransferase n=1 Tax=Novipirellula herctigrandis TaxID=2527986 RepID=A0A5C5Z4K2_9BACT|nr:Galactose-1-phosphate uridylyltransferase [Planctomycetes bacterium CA13]